LLLSKFDKKLDYSDIKGDTYYVLPKREFDRFRDHADSSGYDVDTAIEIIQEGEHKMKAAHILAENYKRFFKFNLGEAEYGKTGHVPDESEFEGDGNKMYTTDAQPWEDAYDSLGALFNNVEDLDAEAPFDADLIALVKKFDEFSEAFEELMANVGVETYR